MITERQLGKIAEPDQGGCMIWQGAKDEKGYGRIAGRIRAHRLVYETFVEPLEGRVLHHVCGNRGCVNPDHLEVLKDQREHMTVHRSKTCPKGHNDWRYEIDGQGYRHRYCATCKRAWVRRRWLAKR